MPNDGGFYAITGMPLSKVQQYQNATTEQKRYAKAFDTNNNGIFDETEADLFNATTFSKEGKNTVVFQTQVKGKKFFGPSKETIETRFNDKPDEIKYDKNNETLAGREIVPYKVFHYDVKSSGLTDKATVKGISFYDNSAKKYTEVYYNNQHMNAVMLKDGTTLIYPDGQTGSVEMTESTTTSYNYRYSWGWGWDIEEGNITTPGNGGWKITRDVDGTGNYCTYFKKIKDAVIIGTGGEDKYQLDNCTSCTVDISQDDNNEDRVYINNRKVQLANNQIKQNKEDITRMTIDNKKAEFDVIVNGKKEINANKLYKDCSEVDYKKKVFRPIEWSGIKNKNIQYSEKFIPEKDIYYWE